MFQCIDANSASIIEFKLKNKYQELITINKVKPSLPMIQIIRINTTHDNPIELIRQIKAQNTWLDKHEIQIIQTYDIR